MRGSYFSNIYYLVSLVCVCICFSFCGLQESADPTEDPTETPPSDPVEISTEVLSLSPVATS